MQATDKPGVYYFAHPYRARHPNGRCNTPVQSTRAQQVNLRTAALMDCGYTVLSPISHSVTIAYDAWLHDMPGWEVYEAAFGDRWYAVDMAILELGGDNWAGIILAPGWEDSKGCRAEREWFEARGLPVLLYEEIMAESQEEDAV